MSEEIYISEEARQHEIDIFANDELALGERTQLLLNQQIQLACLNWKHRDAALQTKIAALEAEVGELRKDKERLDWLNERKSHCYAHWAEGGEWVNPSVIWKVIHFEIEGTYKFSDTLKNMTVRAAIDTALNSTKGEK